MSDDQNRTLTDRITLRLPDGLRDRIKKIAAGYNRSLNAEILATLEEKYPPDDGLKELLLLLIENINDPSKKDECVRIAGEMKRVVSSSKYNNSKSNDIYMASMAMMRELGVISSEEFIQIVEKN